MIINDMTLHIDFTIPADQLQNFLAWRGSPAPNSPDFERSQSFDDFVKDWLQGFTEELKEMEMDNIALGLLSEFGGEGE